MQQSGQAEQGQDKILRSVEQKGKVEGEWLACKHCVTWEFKCKISWFFFFCHSADTGFRLLPWGSVRVLVYVSFHFVRSDYVISAGVGVRVASGVVASP